MRVLLTGHNGYIGPVATRLLRDAGHDVVALDTDFFAPTLRAEGGSLTVVRKDVRDVTAQDLAGIEGVVHLAAISNDPMGQLDADWTYDINLRATLRLAELARAEGVERFLFMSSCSVYGAAGDGEVDEDGVLAPLTHYATSKVRAEESLAPLADSGFTPVFLRNATAYGVSPHMRTDLVVNNLCGWAHATGTVAVMGDGSPLRPLVHIEDISRAIVALLTAPRELVSAKPFNVGVPGENYRVRELAEIVAAAVPGSRVELRGTSGDARSYRVDFNRLLRVVPTYRPLWTVPAGVAEICAAYRAVDLTVEDLSSRQYVRLAQLQHLLDEGRLDERLRWKAAA